MTLAEYEELLADLVARDKITIGDAKKLRQMFINGEINEDDLPLPITRATEKDDDAVLLFLTLTLTSKRLDDSIREAEREEILQKLDAQMATLGYALARDEISISEWQKRARNAISGAMAAQWTTGNGTNAQSDIADIIDEQLTYLYRFTGEMHARQALGNPYGDEYMVNRLLLYGGAVWAAWFIGNESVNYDDGYVAQYIAADDIKTCRNCSNAQGYYRINSGPMPGQICYGGGRCRCVRTIIYAPEIARTL
jgi:hypothetical protein